MAVSVAPRTKRKKLKRPKSKRRSRSRSKSRNGRKKKGPKPPTVEPDRLRLTNCVKPPPPSNNAADDGDDPLPVPRLIPELLVHFSLTNLSYWYRNKDIMGNDLLRFRGVEQRGSRWNARVYLNSLKNKTSRRSKSPPRSPPRKRSKSPSRKRSKSPSRKRSKSPSSQRAKSPSRGRGRSGSNLPVSLARYRKKWRVDVSFLGSFESRLIALKKCDEAVKARDSPPPPRDLPPDQRLSTHWKMVVVSNQFDGMSAFDRLSLVYEQLLAAFWDKERGVPVGREAVTDTTSTRKSYGYLGVRVRNLPENQYLPVSLRLLTLTAHEWKPKTYAIGMTSKYGASHLDEKGIATKVTANPKTVSKVLLDRADVPLTNKPSTPALPSGKKGKRRKGKKDKDDEPSFLANFGLAQLAVLQEEERRKKIRKKERKNKQFDLLKDIDEEMSIRTGTSVGGTSEDSLSVASGSTVGTPKSSKRPESRQQRKRRISMHQAKMNFTQTIGNLKAQATPAMQFKNQQDPQRRCMVGAQRLYRAHLMGRFLRWRVKRHRSATDMARFYRGYVSRLYSSFFREVRTLAALQFSRRWRGILDRRWVVEYRKIRIAAAIEGQRIVRGKLARLLTERARRLGPFVRVIQRFVRGHFGRVRHQLLVARAWYRAHVRPAIVRIQALMRGVLDRKYMRQVMFMVRHFRFSIPACQKMQNVFRGHVGRKRMRWIRALFNGARGLQRLYRGHCARRRAERRRYWFKSQWAATKIVSVARVFLARQLATEYRWRKFVKEVAIPAAILMQAVYRSYAVRRERARQIARLKASIIIQGLWRANIASLELKQRWIELLERRRHVLAATLQKVVRGFFARDLVRRMHRTNFSQRIHAAFVLQSAWRAYKARCVMWRKRLIAEAQWSRHCIRECNIDAAVFEKQIEELDFTVIRKAKSNRKYIRKMRALVKSRFEYKARIPNIELELKNLDLESLEEGWGDALQVEWHKKTEIVDMAAEEIRGWQVMAKEAAEACDDAMMKREEIEWDLDEVYIEEVEEFQTLRLREFDLVERQKQEDWRKAVARQRKRWKVHSTKVKTIKRRDAAKVAQWQADRPKPNIPVPRYFSVDYQKMKAQENKRNAKYEQVKRQRAAAFFNQGRIEGVMNKTISGAYDEVSNNTLKLIKEFDFKSSIGRNKSVPGKGADDMCRTCGKMLCDCHKISKENKEFLF